MMIEHRPNRLARFTAVVATALAAVAVPVVLAPPVGASTAVPTLRSKGGGGGGGGGGGTPLPLSGWNFVDSNQQSTSTAGQGLATITNGSKTTIVYRGDSSIPFFLRLAGWNHIGDPDASGGYIFDAFQSASGTAKLYSVTTPGGTRYDYTHTLDSGINELMNNSFAAVSPDAQWLVSGEWGTMSRLLVFPTPLLNPATPATGGSLAVAGTITLDTPVSNVQGCDFLTATRILCSSDGTAVNGTVQKPLLQIDLGAALGTAATSTTGAVTVLGGLPTQSTCSGVFETEGMDYNPATGDLRVEMIPPSPCDSQVTIYRYRHA